MTLSALTYLLVLLFGPRTLNQVWIQHSQPPVLTLLVTAVLGTGMGTALCYTRGSRGPKSSKSDSSPRTHRLSHRTPAEACGEYIWRPCAQGTGHRGRNLSFSPQLQQTRPRKPSMQEGLLPVSQPGAVKSEQSPTAQTQGASTRRSSSMQTLGFPAGQGSLTGK